MDLSVIECTNCGAQSEGEEFCPACGEWLQVEGFEDFELDNQAVAQVPYNSVSCPSCGAANPSTNRHCEECGARLMQGTLPVAPQPILSTAPGVRAAIGIGALLIGVLFLAFLFNWIGGDDEAATPDDTSTTSSSTSSIPLAQIELVPVTDPVCSSELGPSWACSNMFDGDTTTVWNDASLGGVGATITVTFPSEYALDQIIITNIDDDEVRFLRNFRVASIDITSDDNQVGKLTLLPDDMGAHIIDFQTFGSRTVTIEVQTTFQAEPQIDAESNEELRAFTELVIAEIEFYGSPVGGG